jgi:hypothetical protein
VDDRRIARPDVLVKEAIVEARRLDAEADNLT